MGCNQSKQYQEALALFVPLNDLSAYQPKRIISIELLKKLYRKKIMFFHPDRSQLTGLDEDYLSNQFKRYTDAFQYLLKYCEKPTFTKVTKTPPAYSKKQKNETFYYHGEVPNIILRLAEYLFYRGIIHWQELIEALCWQTRNRPRLGQIGIDLGYFTPDKVKMLMEECYYKEKIGTAAVRLNFIDNYQLFVLLGRQKQMDLPIGRYFTMTKKINESRLNHYNQQLQEHNRQMKKHEKSGK
ncbi:MAG: hypothetical protein MJB14_18780 [Spirochaetes bacterium]|nr:hypothetical protein [Spirochaetota bacterium]